MLSTKVPALLFEAGREIVHVLHAETSVALQTRTTASCFDGFPLITNRI